jgi:hypothetical protein
MALLRWIHLRKLVSIEDLIAGVATTAKASVASGFSRTEPPAAKPASVTPPSPTPVRTAPPGPPAGDSSFKDAFLAEIRKSKVAFYNMVVAQARTIEIAGDRIVFTFSGSQRALKEQVEQNKAWLESMAVAAGRRVTVTATQDASGGPRSAIASPQSPVSSPQPSGSSQAAVPQAAAGADADRKAALKAQALADSGVQAMLEVFPAEIRDVEEM